MGLAGTDMLELEDGELLSPSHPAKPGVLTYFKTKLIDL